MIQMRELNFFECRCLASIQVVSYRESRKLFFGVVDFHVKIVFEWLIRVNRFACHISMNIYRKCIPPLFLLFNSFFWLPTPADTSLF